MGTGKNEAALNYFEVAINKGKEISEHYAAESAINGWKSGIYKNMDYSRAQRIL